MKNTYLAIFRYNDKNKKVAIAFPDMPGFVSSGDNMDDAFRMAHEALAAHIETLKNAGKKIPRAKAIKEIMQKWSGWKEWTRGGKYFVVPITYVPILTKNKRVHVLMDESLVDEIDRVSTNRSAFICDAVKRALKGE